MGRDRASQKSKSVRGHRGRTRKPDRLTALRAAWARLTERMEENLFLELGEPTNTQVLRQCELALLTQDVTKLKEARSRRLTWCGPKEHELRALADEIVAAARAAR